MRTIFLGETIGIRPYRAGDAQGLYEAARLSIGRPFLPWCHENYSMEEAEKFEQEARTGWEDGSRFAFVIFDRDTDAYAGGVGINFINRVHGFANLGYWVAKAWEGRGVATAAARLAARFALDEVGLQRVEIVVAPDNAASLRVAEKAGAVREGLLRRRLRIYGEAVDAVMFSIVGD